MVAKRRKRENRKIFEKSRTYRAIDAWRYIHLLYINSPIQSNSKDN